MLYEENDREFVAAVARALGLEVSPRAPVAHTVERVRAALLRLDP